jgi:hypothetical protein
MYGVGIKPVLANPIFNPTSIINDKSIDYAGNILFSNYWVAVVMAAFLGLCALYTIAVVPILKKKAAARVKRRPGKIS